jgi:hypothetical protein
VPDTYPGLSSTFFSTLNLISIILILTSTFTCTPPKYNSIEISYLNSQDGIELSGTLTIPRGGKNFPAVLLIQGTGPHNRDEEILGHKPFRVIADYLSGNGIAVLRVDRRGTGKSGGTFLDLDMDNYVEDALYGIEFLKSYPGIDTNKIGMIGHSLGGFIAAMASARTNDAAFIISCGGPGIWGRDIGYSLNRQWAEISGASAEDLKEVKRLSYRWYDLVTKESVTPEEEDEFTGIYIRLSYYLNEDLRRLFYPGPADKALAVFRSPQYQNALQIDPHSVWSSVRCPVLAINGDKDFQASADENLTGIENGLIAGKNSDYKIVKLENHNHLFQRTGNGSPAEYAKIKETFSTVALEVIYNWIDSVTTRGSTKR